jgi:hypothetical protein
MLKKLIGKAIRVVDDGGVETVLTLAFVAQFAAYALPLHAVSDFDAHIVSHESIVVTDVGETGTVVQMPASPTTGRTARAVIVRQQTGANRSAASAAAKGARAAGLQPTRVRRPDPVDDEPGADEAGRLGASESSVRITIIGPDGQPRTKVVRLSGSRDGMTAPARRPHD